MSTNAFSQLLGGQQAIGFHNSLLGMHPLGLDRIEPGTFGGQKEGQDAHPGALLLDLAVVLTNPGSYQLAVMPGSVIPDQQPAGLARRLQSGADPLQELRGDGAHWTAIHKTQRHLAAERISGRTLLPQHSIAGKGFWIRIILLPDLFHQAVRLVFALPGIERGQSKPAPPHLIQKADRPAWLLTTPGDQPIACVFFTRYWGSGLVIQCLARFQLFPKRLRARRILSPETKREVSLCW